MESRTLEPRTNINLRHIRAFVSVAELGSFTRAANALSISQSALTVSVRQLEDDVGLTLFHRTTRRVTLTEAGVEFFPTARRLLRDFHAAIADMQAMVHLRRGRVGVAALPSVSAEWLPAIVAQFSRDYPGIDVEVISENSHGIHRRVASKEIDFGIVGQILPDADISHQKVVSQPVALVCPPDHPLAGKPDPVCWADLKGSVFIHAGNDDCIRAVLEKVPALSDTLLETRYRANKADIVAAMVREGIGVTAVTPVILPRDIRRQLVVRPLRKPDMARTIYLIRRRGRVLSPAAELFMKQALAAIRGTPHAEQHDNLPPAASIA